MGGRPQLSAAEWARPEVLFAFIDELRHLGWNLGTAHYGAAQDLLLRLVAGPWPAPATAVPSHDGPGERDRPDRLAGLLGPLLCSTPREQEDLPRLLARWGVGPGRALSDALAASDSAEREDQEPRDGDGGARSPAGADRRRLGERPLAQALERIERGSRAWPAAVAVIVVILSLAVLYYYETLQRYAAATGDIVLKPAYSLANFTAGWLVATRLTAGWLLAAAAIIAFGYLCWRLWLALLGRQFLVRRSAAGAPALEPLSVRAPSEALFAPRPLRRSAEQLRRRVAQPGRELHLEATVERTARQGGWPAPVTASQLVRPEYLVLIERANPGDQRSRYFDELAEQLARQGVVLERAYFDGDPRTCFRANRNPAGAAAPSPLSAEWTAVGRSAPPSRAVEAGPDLPSQEPAAASRPAGAETSAGMAATPVGLRELYSLYPDHRLLLVTNAQGLFSPISGEEEPWVGQLLAWKHRALLIPRPVEEWGRRERELARRFAVVPATLAGWADLAAVFEGRGSPPSPRPAAAVEAAGAALAAGDPLLRLPLPDDLRLRPWPWLARNPQEPRQVERMLDELERSLGDAGFYWLAACAVYPALDWEMTVSLGQMLAIDGEPLYDPPRLAALLELPWLRRGTMPDWLRKSLLARLSRRREVEVREAIAALLLTTLEGTDPRAAGAFTLEVASRHRHALTRLWRPVWRRLARHPGEDSPARDYVFRDFMAGRHRRLAVALPERLARVLTGRRSATTQADLVDSPAMRRARFVMISLLVASALALGLIDPWAQGSALWTLLILAAANVALTALAYVWRKAHLSAFSAVTVLLVIISWLLMFLGRAPRTLIFFAVTGLGLLFAKNKFGQLGPVARAQRLARASHVLVVAGAAYLVAGAAQAASATVTVHLLASGAALAVTAALLALAYSEQSAWLLLASAPVAVPGLVWLLIRDPLATLTPAETRRGVLLLFLGAAACLAARRSLAVSAIIPLPLAARSAGLVRPSLLERIRPDALGSGPNMTLIRRSSLFFAGLFVLFTSYSLTTSLASGDVSIKLLLLSSLVASIIYSTAVSCALYARKRWTFADRKLLAYLRVGFLAAGASLAIEFIADMMSSPRAFQDRRAAAFELIGLVKPFALAVTVASMTGVQRQPSRLGRWAEGLIAGGGLAMATLIRAIALTALPILFTTHILIGSLILYFSVGFFTGFLIPAWYRETRREAVLGTPGARERSTPLEAAAGKLSRKPKRGDRLGEKRKGRGPMETVWTYAVVCGVIGFIPFSAILLILIEIGMVYHISVNHRIPFSLGELAVLWGCLVAVSAVFKLVVGTMFLWIPVIGWLAKGGLAFVFVLGAGWLVDRYYAAEALKRKIPQT
jgi:hypothetical protein